MHFFAVISALQHAIIMSQVGRRATVFGDGVLPEDINDLIMQTGCCWPTWLELVPAVSVRVREADSHPEVACHLCSQHNSCVVDVFEGLGEYRPTMPLPESASHNGLGYPVEFCLGLLQGRHERGAGVVIGLRGLRCHHARQSLVAVSEHAHYRRQRCLGIPEASLKSGSAPRGSGSPEVFPVASPRIMSPTP